MSLRILWPRLAPWIVAGEPFALGTVVATHGSTPRPPGACVAVFHDGSRFHGSVSSGCLEIEVLEAGRAVAGTDEVRRLRFGPDGVPPWSDGLTCGGWIEVRVESWWGCHPRAAVRAIADELRRWCEDDPPGAGVVISRGGFHLAIDGSGRQVGDRAAFDAETIERGVAILESGEPPIETGPTGEMVFYHAIPAPPTLLMVGAVDVAVHLAPLARQAGFRSVVVDPREAYVATERFPRESGAVLRAWPESVIPGLELGPRDAAVVLTHDPKIDDPALLALLRTRVGYIGALGSSRSHASRLSRLREEAEEGELRRITGPAGIHLGTTEAPGIAVGILAGLVRWRAALDQRPAAAALPAR